MLTKPRKLVRLLSTIYLMIVTYLPGPIGFDLRYRYWRKRLKYIGKNVRISTGVYFQNPEYISIDDNCWIDMNVSILAGLDSSKREKIIIKNEAYKGEKGVVHIGKNVHVGIGCIISGISAGVYISDNCGLSAQSKIYSLCHHYQSKKDPTNKEIYFSPLVPQKNQCIIEGAVTLGLNTGVALNSVILPGVSIPENCFVAINAVVRPGDYRNNSILSGNPAERVGDRFESNE